MVVSDDHGFLDWCLTFFKQLKAIGKIKDFSGEGNRFVFYKPNMVEVFILPDLSKVTFETIPKGGIVFTLNKKSNLTFLIDNWNSFVDREITLYFVNPKFNDKWVLNTKVHNFIVDKQNLKKSLLALFSNVQEVL